MATVLIVDDSQVDQRLAGGLLARHVPHLDLEPPFAFEAVVEPLA